MSLVNLLVAARSAISEWRNRDRAYGELMSLDDRSLADIGIHRSEIPAIVEGFHESRRRSGPGSRPVGDECAPEPARHRASLAAANLTGS